LAPFWTDLNGVEPGSQPVLVNILTDGVSDWLVIEWQMKLWGASGDTVDDQLRVFQLWIGLNGEEDITFAYDPTNLPMAPPASYGLTVGAENANGTEGDQIDGVPEGDLRVTSTPGDPGGSDSYTFTVRGTTPGNGSVL